MNGATKSEVPSAFWMANVLGASSPNTTCRKEAMNRAMAIAMGCSSEAGRFRASSSGSMRFAMAGSARAPMPSEQTVMPSWQTARYWSSFSWATLTRRAEGLPSSTRRSTCVPLIRTKANSAATNRPLSATRKRAARILRIGRAADATTSRMTPRRIGGVPGGGTRRYSMCRQCPFGATLNIPCRAPGQTLPSVQQPLVEHVAERLPGQVAPQVLAEEDGLRGVYELGHYVCGVGAYDHVLHPPEGAVLRQRLNLEHVERRPREVPALQSLYERRLFHDLAAADVGEKGARLDGGHGPRVEQALGLRRAGQRKRYEVRFGKDPGQVPGLVEIVEGGPGRIVLAHLALNAHDAHAERARPVGYGPAYAPRPDDAQRLALQRPGRALAPGLGGLVPPQQVEALRVLEHAHEHELGERAGVDAAGRRHQDVVPGQQASRPRDLACPGHAPLHPPQPRRYIRQVSDVTARKIVENLGLREHPQERLLLLGRPPPVLGAVVVPLPPRRRDEVGPVEDLETVVHLPETADELFLEEAGHDDGRQFVSLRSTARWLRQLVSTLRLTPTPSARRFAPFSTSPSATFGRKPRASGGAVSRPSRREVQGRRPAGS